MRRALAVLAIVLSACGGSAPRDASPDSDGGSPADAGVPPAGAAQGPVLAGCPVFGPASEWNRDVSQDPVDAHSTEYMIQLGASFRLQPDFGRPPYGMPLNVVPGSQPKVPIAFLYASQSDPGPYPIPPDVRLQDNADRHAVVIDRDACLSYETYATTPDGHGGFTADSGAVFDLRSPALRPDGWTAATASGLSIVAGLVRYDEATAGEIRHAVSFIAGRTAHAYVHPATHSSGTSTAAYAPPMGLRVRLRRDFDLSGYHGASLAILQAMRRYGMLLVDNAGGLPFWSVAGEQDARWDPADLDQLKSVPTAAFEVVRLGPVYPGN